MIRKDTLVATLPMSFSYAETNKTLVAKPNTLLAELVRHSIPPYALEVKDQEGLDTFFGAMEVTTTGSLETPSSHSLELDAIITDLSKLVTGHISYAKNIVKNLVVDFAEDIARYREENANKDPSAKFNIETLNIPELLKDGFFLDNINYYNGKTIIRPDVRFSLADKSRESILELMMTGDKKTDKLALEWLASLPEEFLPALWLSFFTDLGDARAVISFDALERLNVYDKANYALGIYLLARKLYDQVDESAKDMNLSSYKKVALEYRDYAGAVLAACVKAMAQFLSSKTLVVELNASRYQAKVNGDVYRQWLSQGGSPEVILGLIVSGEQISTQALINSKAENLLAQWNSYCTFAKTSDSNKAFTSYKQFLLNRFSTMMNSLDDSERAYQESHPNYRSNVVNLLETEVENLKASDMNDPYEVALRLIAKCRFYYTSAYDILSNINEAGKINPNIDIREAALLAVVAYVSDYVAEQIGVAV